MIDYRVFFEEKGELPARRQLCRFVNNNNVDVVQITQFTDVENRTKGFTLFYNSKEEEKKTKLFRVYRTGKVGWDEFDSYVIAADSKETVEKMVKTAPDEIDDDDWSSLQGETFFPDMSGEYQISEIDIQSFDKPTILCASFNAG